MESAAFNQLADKIRQGSLDEVWSVLESQVDAKEIDVQFLLGMYYRALNKYEEAIKHYELAVQLEPENPDLLFGLGIVQQLAGRLDDAIDTFRRCVEMQPGNVLAWNSIGVTFRKKKDFQNAIAAYERGLSQLIEAAYSALRTENGPRFPLTDEYLGGAEMQEWMKLAMETAIAHASKDGKKDVRFPAGETAAKLHSDNNQDLFLDDEAGTRNVLPNYFSSMFSLLKTNSLCSQVIGNLASTHIYTGDLELAEKLTREAGRLMPEGADSKAWTEQLAIIQDLKEKKKAA